MGKKIICLTGLGDYRKGVINKIIKAPVAIDIIAGTQAFEKSIKLLDANDFDQINFVENTFILNRKLMIQKGSFLKCLSADKLIIDLNPRVINVWLVIILRLMLGKKTCTWGHAWPRSNKKGILRWLLKKLSHKVIVYTETQRQEILKIDSTINVVAAPNALYDKEDILNNIKFLNNDPKNIIHVGRIVASKKVNLIIEAFALIKDKLPKGSKLILVGDGDDLNKLKNRTFELNLQDSIIFTGHVIDPIKLREYYTSSLFSISAGYVGLSITQSFSFGVPMLISTNEPHSPEIEAAVEGKNSVFFTTDSIDDLSAKILEFYKDKNYWLNSRSKIIENCAENYSTDKMAQRILSCFED